jgi:hypothetical protein
MAHFGGAASDMGSAYRWASKILPLVTTFHMPIHPSLAYWVEISTGAALFKEHNFNPAYQITYQDSEPSDSGLFYGISEYVEDALNGNVASRYTPLQVRKWLAILARNVRSDIVAAETELKGNKEFEATKVDLLMLADLAEYHTQKIMAALQWSYYEKADNLEYLKQSCRFAVSALKGWENLSERGSVYHGNLEFGVGGVGKSGHWKDRLPELEKDVHRLKSLLAEQGIDPALDEGSTSYEGHIMTNDLSHYVTDVPEYCTAGKDLTVNVELGEVNGLSGNLRMHYRHMNQLEGKFKVVEMERTDKGCKGVIGGEYITGEWDIMVYFSGVTEDQNVVIYPGVYHPHFLAPYHIVKVK